MVLLTSVLQCAMRQVKKKRKWKYLLGAFPKQKHTETIQKAARFNLLNASVHNIMHAWHQTLQTCITLCALYTHEAPYTRCPPPLTLFRGGVIHEQRGRNVCELHRMPFQLHAFLPHTHTNTYTRAHLLARTHTRPGNRCGVAEEGAGGSSLFCLAADP